MKKTKTYKPKKTLKQKALVRGAIKLRGAHWQDRCPGCGGHQFRVFNDQLTKGSCFCSLRLECVDCKDGLVIETFIAAGSKTGDRLKLTLADELRDKGQMVRAWCWKMLAADPGLTDRIKAMSKAEMQKAALQIF